MFVYELSGCGFEYSCSHLNFRFPACFEQRFPWHSGNYRVWIHSEMHTWHDKNIQSMGQIVLTTDSVIQKYWLISIKFKICISQLIAKSLLKQLNLNQIRHYLPGHSQIWCHIFFSQKMLKYFNDSKNQSFSVLWL